MLSKVNPVVSDWLGKTAPNLFVPEPKNVWLHSSLPFVQGVEIFSAIRMREKYYSLHDCLDGLCSAGYNQSGDGRADCLLLFRSHPARRRDYGRAGRACSVQVGRDGWIKQRHRGYHQSSSPIRSMQVLWLQQLRLRYASFPDESVCSISCEAGCWLCPHRL